MLLLKLFVLPGQPCLFFRLGLQALTLLIQGRGQPRLLLAQLFALLRDPGGLGLKFGGPLLQLDDLALRSGRPAGQLLFVALQRGHLRRFIGQFLFQRRDLPAYVAQFVAELTLFAFEAVELALQLCRTGAQRLAFFLLGLGLFLGGLPLARLLIEILLKPGQLLLELIGVGL